MADSAPTVDDRMIVDPLAVGFDLDGVWFDYVDNVRQIAKDWAREVGVARRLEMTPRRHPFDAPATQWHFYLDWDLTKEEFAEINRYGIETGRLFRGGFRHWHDVIRELRFLGHSVHVITHRTIPGAKAATEQWMTEHGIEVDSVTFVTDGAKKSIVGVDVLVDDKYENLLAFATQEHTTIPEGEKQRWGLLYHRSYNEMYQTHDGTSTRPGAITRVATPASTVEMIQRIAVYKTWAREQRSAEPTIFDIFSDTEPKRDLTPKREYPTSPPPSILEEAQSLVHGDRGEDYGHPIHDFARTGTIWGALLDEWKTSTADEHNAPVPPEIVGLCMVGVKLSREINRAKRDNRVDGAGYFETVDMVHDYRAKAEAGVVCEMAPKAAS